MWRRKKRKSEKLTQMSMCRYDRTFSIEKTSHRESSCNVIVHDGRLLTVELRSPILWPCGNRHRQYLCLLLPRAVTEEAGEGEEEEEEDEDGEAHVCQRCTMHELYIIPLRILIEAHCLPPSPRLYRNLEYLWHSLRRTWSSLGEREVPASFRFVSKDEVERERERFCAARILDMARLRRRFITV